MAAGVALLLWERHSHWHHHEVVRHAHRHHHDPRGGDPHHEHPHTPEDLAGISVDAPFWHAHEHHHGELEHAHPGPEGDGAGRPWPPALPNRRSVDRLRAALLMVRGGLKG